MPSAKIFTMYYKKGEILPLGDFYAPLFCGASVDQPPATFLRDDQGQNISAKNEFYSELTGIYWAWKNTRQDITGICHYRRYFTVYPETWYLRLKYLITHPLKLKSGPNPLIYTNNVRKYTPWILTEAQALDLLEHYDILLPRARFFRYSVERHYSKYHDLRDLKLIQEILEELHPEFVPSWKEVLAGNLLYANNMFVLKSTYYNEFMEWWFGVLFEYERRCDLQSYQGYQKRILGFLAERLLTLWVTHKRPKIKELQLLYFKKFKKA